MQRLEVEVWSDIACPWCWVGKRRLEAALSSFAASDRVALRWRAFELDPSAPRVQDPGAAYAERLARKYGVAVVEAQAMIDRMTSVGADEGITFRFDRVRAGNTFDAHRVIHLAGSFEREDAMKERLLRAYFSEGEAVGEIAVLARLAGEVGLDEALVLRMLAGDDFRDAVRADEAQAAALGIRGVPFFVIDRRYGVSGAQPPEQLRSLLERAWSETHGLAPAAESVCGPDGCA